MGLYVIMMELHFQKEGLCIHLQGIYRNSYIHYIRKTEKATNFYSVVLIVFFIAGFPETTNLISFLYMGELACYVAL